MKPTFEEVLAAAGLDELVRDLTQVARRGQKSYARNRISDFARSLLSQYEEATRVEEARVCKRCQDRNKCPRRCSCVCHEQYYGWNANLQVRDEKVAKFMNEK